MVGPCEVGDEVVVNTAAIDLGLGSGGFDVVHVNLTRGLEGGETPPGVHVMKLNYSSLQHAVEPVEAPAGRPARARPADPGRSCCRCTGISRRSAWAAAQAGAERRVGFVQAGGRGAARAALGRRDASCATAGCSPGT